MSQLGITAMLHQLTGDSSSRKAFKSAVGKTISKAILNDDALFFEFDDGSKIKLFDDGQSCCERRYMTTDDNPADHAGEKLVGAEIKDAPDQEDEYGDVHEVQFLEIKTDRGFFTVATHNEHNGCYGGFVIRCEAGL